MPPEIVEIRSGGLPAMVPHHTQAFSLTKSDWPGQARGIWKLRSSEGADTWVKTGRRLDLNPQQSGGCRSIGTPLGPGHAAIDVGMAQASPSSHGKFSQHSVTEDRRIAFAVACNGDDAIRENFSFFLLIVGQVELAADFIKGD